MSRFNSACNFVQPIGNRSLHFPCSFTPFTNDKKGKTGSFFFIFLYTQQSNIHRTVLKTKIHYQVFVAQMRTVSKGKGSSSFNLSRPIHDRATLMRESRGQRQRRRSWRVEWNNYRRDEESGICGRGYVGRSEEVSTIETEDNGLVLAVLDFGFPNLNWLD